MEVGGTYWAPPLPEGGRDLSFSGVATGEVPMPLWTALPHGPIK